MDAPHRRTRRTSIEALEQRRLMDGAAEEARIDVTSAAWAVSGQIGEILEAEQRSTLAERQAAFARQAEDARNRGNALSRQVGDLRSKTTYDRSPFDALEGKRVPPADLPPQAILPPPAAAAHERIVGGMLRSADAIAAAAERGDTTGAAAQTKTLQRSIDRYFLRSSKALFKLQKQFAAQGMAFPRAANAYVDEVVRQREELRSLEQASDASMRTLSEALRQSSAIARELQQQDPDIRERADGIDGTTAEERRKLENALERSLRGATGKTIDIAMGAAGTRAERVEGGWRLAMSEEELQSLAARVGASVREYGAVRSSTVAALWLALRDSAVGEGLVAARGIQEAEAEAKRQAEEQARREREEAERLAREEAERIAREEAERIAREEAERVAREETERVAREEAERVAREEAERLAREEAERVVREEAERIAREEAERIAREEAERIAREEAERIAREEAERVAREEAERVAREEAERVAREEAERIAREETERIAREEAERIAREEAERVAREEAERIAREETERIAREEAERIAREEAERVARETAERIAREEAERIAREEAERIAREETERLAREEVERVAREEAERIAREETERLAREEAERIARETAERIAREETERLAREEIERIAREEAERIIREETERLAREEAERVAREEAERIAREEAERIAREEAERIAREEAERIAREEAERIAREEAERLAREEVERIAREEAERISREEAERVAREEAERIIAQEAAERLAAAEGLAAAVMEVTAQEGNEANERLIVPKLQLARLEGSVVLVAFASPADRSILSFEQNGMFDTVEITHEGGTPFSMASVTFPYNRRTESYWLTLRDPATGNLLAGIPFHWDMPSRSLSLDDPAAVLTMAPADGSEPGAAAAAQAFEQILTMSTVDVSDAQIQRIFETQMYEETAALPEGVRLFVTIDEQMERMFAQYPQYRPENWEAGIQALWDQMGRTYTRGQVESTFHNVRLDIDRLWRENLDAYARETAVLLRSALNGLLKVKKGGDEWMFRDLFTEAVAAAEKRTKVDLPHPGMITGAGKALFDRALPEALRAQDALVKYRDWLFAQEEIKWKELEALGWEESGGDRAALPEGMSRREISRAAKIRKTLETSQDPRVVALRNNQRRILTKEQLDDLSVQIGGMEVVWEGVHPAASEEEETLHPMVIGQKIVASGLLDTIEYPKEEPLPLGIESSRSLNFNARKGVVIPIELPESYMVNLWVDNDTARGNGALFGAGININLTLSGWTFDGKWISWTSGKAFDAAESVSTELPRGTYELRIEDKTDPESYRLFGAPADLSANTISAVLGFNIKKYNSAHIEGQISIKSRNVSMRVRMSVAAFNADGKRIDYDPITNEPLKLNPKIPVVTLIHGRKSSGMDDPIVELARNLTLAGKQVVIVDWSEAAKDFAHLNIDFPTEGGDYGSLRDASWTIPVGQWVARRLFQAEVPAANTFSIDHSHGVYVGYFMGEEMTKLTNGKKIGGLVAMDPAKNPWFADNDVKEESIVLRNVADKSWSFVSSMLGSEDIADTADYFTDVLSEDRHALSPKAMDAHWYAVDLVSDIVARRDDVDPAVSLTTLMSRKEAPGLKERTGPECSITVVLDTRPDMERRKALYGQFFNIGNGGEGQSSGSN